jgi:hypothetical protein
MVNNLPLKGNLPEARSTEGMVGSVACQALQDIQGLAGHRLGPTGFGTLRLMALEHHTGGSEVAYTVAEIPMSAAEVPSMGCNDVVNRSYRSRHVAACQFCLSFQHSTYP